MSGRHKDASPVRGLILLAMVANSAPLGADTVVMTNGDRISGRLVRKGPAAVVLETAYAGEIRLQVAAIRTLETDEPVHIMRRDDTQITTASLSAGDDGQVVLGSGRVLALSDIAYINPTPSQSGQGVLYSGHLTFSASANSGNSKTRRVYGEIELDGEARDWRFSIGARAEQRRDEVRKTASNWRVAGNYDHFFRPTRFLYTRASLEHDPFKDLQLRGAVGSGYGWQIIDNARTKFSIQIGLDYVIENNDSAPNSSYPALGWGLKVSHWLLSDWVQFFHEQEGFINLTDGQDDTVHSTTGFRVPLLDNMTANAQLNVDWDGEPAPGRDSTDTTLLFGVGMTW